MKILLYFPGFISMIFAFIPLIMSKYWWVRGFDFPHIQFTCLTLISIILFSFHLPDFNTRDIVMLILLIGTLIYQLKIVYPYTRLSPKQVSDVKFDREDSRMKVFTSNVLQDNHDFDKFYKVLKSNNPDLALMLETDRWWVDQLEVLKDEYPYTVPYPLDNYYGMALYSKFPIRGMEVKFLVSDDIPSIHGEVQLKNGTWVKILCLHPMPPSPTENKKSLDRDAELLLVAKNIGEKDYPIIVLGDLNDVAWSHTTRMFQRISRLLDPRIGRGFYNTFHVRYPFLRWPLDHLFVSEDFQLLELSRLEDVGSDHFPVSATLCHGCDVEENKAPPQADAEDIREAKETIEEGLEENGKTEETF